MERRHTQVNLPTSRRQCWLRTNRRAVLAALNAPLVLIGLGLVLALWGWNEMGSWPIVAPLNVFGVILVLSGFWMFAALVQQWRRPRLAYEDGHLLVYLQRSDPERLPIEFVECFFLGRAPSGIGKGSRRESPTTSIVVRIAERASRWKDRDVVSALGRWRDGYITIRGTWCEPITEQLLRNLNARLREIHKSRNQTHSAVNGDRAQPANANRENAQ